MTVYLCKTCGVEQARGEGDGPPEACPICLDERQYVGWRRQEWTTLEELRRSGHRNELREEEPGLMSIHTIPQVAIGQRALLVQTPAGNALFDCITYLDQPTIDAVRALGGIQAMGVSHPHFYGSMTEWSEAFGNAPIFIPEADRTWVQRPSPNSRFWEGDAIEILPGLSLLRLGGHFEGATVLHWPEGAEGRGAIMTGDTVTVVMDRQWVSFMYSYPNLIPLPAAAIQRIVDLLRRYPFDRIYGGWVGRTVPSGGMAAVERSAERYIRAQQG
ncbi:MAG: MBL fold metallo-hydrolase [Chloroflexi bacterium]|nr:MBL fold metallo-hydrolase [Chloroflexota bacterium]